MKIRDIYEALDQIKSCGFKDKHGHPIENNVGFVFLEQYIFAESDLQENDRGLNG
jgi:hemerythrin-like domain-containing protein